MIILEKRIPIESERTADTMQTTGLFGVKYFFARRVLTGETAQNCAPT